jgi:hypothetical protein
VSAEIIQFVPRDRRERAFVAMANDSRPKATPDDLVMGHADTAPCEYSPWRELPSSHDELA